MPSNQAKAIPEPEWNQHKDEIIRLFSTGTMETLRQKMEERGFSATESQYEARLRKWGIRKNGTRDDWKSIGRVAKMREQEGKRTVVYMYGKRISTAKARKQISRYLSASEMDGLAQAAYPEIPDGFSIETPKEDGTFHFPQTEAETTLPIQQITTVNLPSYILEQHFVSRGCTFALGRHYDLEYINPAVLSNRIPSFSREQVVSISNIGTNLYDNALQLISGFRNGTFSNLYPLISTLRSLLPRVAVQDFEGCLNLTLNEEFVNSALTRLIISSTTNNFAGLDAIPHSILECLQNPTNMRLLQDLQSANGPEVAAFAEKLFLAAVESSNAGIVEYLLRMNALDPNRLVCNHEGNRYTPIERAVELDSMEVTRVLIHARVDLKKTMGNSDYGNKGALERALMIKSQAWKQYRSVNLELVQMLLDAGAIRRRATLKFV
ncbi:hypothetical protein F5882DRAFT_444835 [Hyaloscypha sp. PMI_1271]|nr:hypothetical protein F5882DRAFT_444835 [Hyaloscypha sp. PMI_1271]